MLDTRLPLVAIALLALSLGGCVTRFVKEPVFDSEGIQIYLRTEKGFRSVVEKDYEHPTTIASVRLAHILSRIDVRHRAEDGGRREGAIPTDMLYALAEGLSAAFARANSNEQVVVMAIEKRRSLGIFDGDFLTSLVAYVRAGSLFIHLSRLEWPVPQRRGLELPEPRIGDDFSKFRVQGGDAMTVVDPQSVAIDWRDPIFRRPTRTKILPTGEVVRKTILMESAPETWDDVPEIPEMPPDLTPEQLRALADIEEARRDGEITEPEYRARRRAVLEGP
jgi:hypothetical protein